MFFFLANVITPVTPVRSVSSWPIDVSISVTSTLFICYTIERFGLLLLKINNLLVEI